MIKNKLFTLILQFVKMKKTFYKSEVREVILIRTQLHRTETILGPLYLRMDYGNPLQYSCLGNSMDREVLVGYSQQGHKESDTTEQLSTLGPYNIVGRV